ncbi:hypothetical protein MYB_02940 [Mesomycoplasma bovoculi M165/69]|uniref:Uncharacterized protein n=1 Tax=Mesomycoplasma bovoculi M165/69 TaxID=743966 RepID=W5UTY1_9BACT|nr:hypothetical protein MYB_02940 [Mesomycoplasma bovoculi M165/69]
MFNLKMVWIMYLVLKDLMALNKQKLIIQHFFKKAKNFFFFFSTFWNLSLQLLL